MPFRPIKVLIVDSSLELCSMLREAMSKDKAFDEIKTAGGFSGAMRILKSFEPDVILASADVYDENDISLIRDKKIPVVSLIHAGGKKTEYENPEIADSIYISTGSEEKSWEALCSEVCVKAKIAAVPGNSAKTGAVKKKPRDHVVLIGASTGGTDATAEIIKRLPNDLPGIVIVQHMPSGFTKMYAQRLDALSGIRVTEAKDGDRVRHGSALIAPGGFHLRLKNDEEGYYVTCGRGERVNGHCPSVGVLFDSAAKTAGPEAVGVLLTGMGRDGAEGLLHLRQAGAYTIGQDEETSVVYGMPMAAYELGAVVRQAPLQNIADIIVKYLK